MPAGCKHLADGWAPEPGAGPGPPGALLSVGESSARWMGSIQGECCRQAVIDDSSAAEEQGGLRRLEAAERRARGSYEYFREAARAGGRRGVGEGGSRVGKGRQLRDWDSGVKENLISEGGSVRKKEGWRG